MNSSGFVHQPSSLDNSYPCPIESLVSTMCDHASRLPVFQFLFCVHLTTGTQLLVVPACALEVHVACAVQLLL